MPVLDDPVFPLQLSDDHRYLVDQAGAPFLINGDAAWSLAVQLDRQEVATYLDARRAMGFNLILVNVLEHHFSDNPPANVFGDEPFTVDNDFSTPNDTYFEYVDYVVDQAASRGMAVLLCPAYLGYDGGDEGWYQTMVANGAQVLRDYGRYVGGRYASFDNIIWLEGGDYTPPQSGVALVNAVAEGIKDQDTRHLHAAHWAPETSGADVSVGGWLDLNTTYTYGLVYEKSLSDYNRGGDLPHFLLETAYEEDIKQTTPQSLRAQAYYALLTGAVGEIYGHGAIWQFSSNWRNALDTPGSRGMQYVHELFAPRDWSSLVPDQNNEVLVAGQGSYGSDDYAVLAASSALAIAYLPTVRSITVSLDAFSGPVDGSWFDPSAGTTRPVEGSPFSPGSPLEVRSPGQNAEGDSDWVLLLEAAP